MNDNRIKLWVLFFSVGVNTHLIAFAKGEMKKGVPKSFESQSIGGRLISSGKKTFALRP
jgi:hypothetical protein